MKILFWSPLHGQAGTTSNILAVTMITGMLFRKKAVLTQSQFQLNNLEAPIVGANAFTRESREFFREVGLDSLIRSYKAAKIDMETLENCCISLANTNILLLPGTSKNIQESFNYEMDTVMVSLLNAIEQISGIVLIDVSAGDNALSKKLMEEADLIVVNLSQNIWMIEMFFRMYVDVLPDKLFYLIGRYDQNSKYNIHNIRRRYFPKITSSNSGVIPYTTGFNDAQGDGKIVEFIRRSINCTKNDDNYYFMMKAKSVTGKILKHAGVNTERI